MDSLLDAFADPANRAEAQEIIRSLIEAVVLTPVDGKLQVELKGDLTAMLLIGQAQKRNNAPEAELSEALQIKLVAGTGFEPVTFRL